MSDYIRQRREDGPPEDPRLQVHVKAGGTIANVAPASMTVRGSLRLWRQWTGLPFDRDGGIEVPGALAPVRCDIANVWVRHALRTTG